MIFSQRIVLPAAFGGLLGMLVLLPTVARAAPPAIDEAQTLIENGAFTEARKKLAGFVSEVPSERALHRFALGYLAQRQADATSGEAAAAHLKEATDAYREVLALYPDHAATHVNLALVLERRGALKDAVKSWTEVLEARPARANEYGIHVGDLLVRLGRNHEALASYERAAIADPNDQTARHRMLTLLARQGRAKDLVKLARGLGSEAPEISLLAIERALASPEFRADRNDEAIRACVQWAALASAVGVSGARIERLPSKREFPCDCNVQLRQMIGGPPARLSPASVGWWKETPERRHIAASVLLERGRRMRIDTERRHDAMSLLELAQRIAPGLRRYQWGELEGERWVFLDVALELASLYNELGRKVGVPERFARLEDELFRMKGMAIRERDWEGMQRLHTTLGLIYVERGRWQAGQFDNALFQLENALRAGENRAAQAGRDPDPLPHIKESLATVYDKVGRAEAPELRLSASRDYLELDDLESCRRMLGQVQEVPDPLVAEREQLDAILTTREALENVQPGRIDALRDNVEQWTDGANSAFLSNQRFKVLTDLGAAAEKVGEPAKALRLYHSAIASSTHSPDALSLGDVYRLREIERALRRSVDFGANRKLIELHPRPRDDTDMALSWRLYEGSMDKGSVTVSNDLLIGLQIATMEAQDDSKILVRDGRVTVLATAEDSGTQRLVRQLRGVEGVRNVKITRQKKRPPMK